VKEDVRDQALGWTGARVVAQHGTVRHGARSSAVPYTTGAQIREMAGVIP